MSSPLPLITLPDFEGMILDRLYLCCLEIQGINKVFRQAPSIALPPESFPICYPLIDAMQTAIPLQEMGSGRITKARPYVIRVLGSPATETFDQTETQGAQGLIDIVPFYSRFFSYFIGHPKLETPTLGALRYMHQQIFYLESGIVTRPASGGIEHFAIEFTLYITMSAEVNTLA